MTESAVPMDIPADYAAREAALQIGRSFIVQAPAGSGKTELLTQRYLKLLAAVEQPEQVLAITFTRKAMQEMRNRIMLRLQQVAANQPVAAHEQRAVKLAASVLRQNERCQWSLLDHPGRLRIFTIDALCTQLLMRDPEYGAVIGRLRVLEDATPLYRQAIRRMLEDLESADMPGQAGETSLHERLVRVLVHLDGDGLRLEQLLTRMLAIRDQWTGSLGDAMASLGLVLRQRQEAELAAFATALGPPDLFTVMNIMAGIGAGVKDAAHPAARLSRSRAEQGDTTTPTLWQAYWLAQILTTASNAARGPAGITRKRLFPELDEAFDTALTEVQAVYRGWHSDPAAVEAIERMAKYVPVESGDLQDGLLEDVLELLRFLLAELNVVIMTEGQTDFQFLAERALHSLRGHRPEGQAVGEVLLAEDRRLDHLLLDEFQDTSHTQHRLIQQLISGWSPGDGRTLFLVGDPMQSIYRFRAADVGLFTRIVQQGRMGTVAVEVLTLTANFRSRREVVDWINQYFPAIFPARDLRDSGAVRYHPAVAERAAGGSVQLHALRPDQTDEDEAAQITALIDDYRQRADRPTIAVLARARKHLEALARNLVRAGIEFEAVRVDRLASRPVIQDLLAITRAWLHPADRVAAAALLRAPWCGLRLAELHRVIGENPEDDVWQRIAQAAEDPEICPELRRRLGRLGRLMDRACGLPENLSLRELVEFSWLQLGGPYAYADASELDNAAEYLNLLQRVEQEGRSELLQRLSEALDALYAQGKPANVQLMTIHQAKGLEFDVVILPGLHRISAGRGQDLIMAQQFTLDAEHGAGALCGESGLLMAPVTPRGREAPSVYRYLKAVDAERQHYETIRLLYVAATRTRERLHLFGRFKFSANKGCYADNGSFLHLLAAAFEPAFNARACQVETTQAAETETMTLPLLRLVNAPEINLAAPDFSHAEAAVRPALPDRDGVALGQALHLWLELMHDHRDRKWSTTWFDEHPAMLESLLQRAGAHPDSVGRLLPRLRGMLQLALEQECGRRAFSPHGASESHAEFTLYKREGNRIVQRIIDRLYRDQSGRWHIVDYKTGGSGDGLQAQWNAQLSAYAEMVRSITGADWPACRVYQAEECRSIPMTAVSAPGSISGDEGVPA